MFGEGTSPELSGRQSKKRAQRIQLFNQQTIEQQRKARQLEYKHIFFQFAFSESELHEMFKDFHQKYIKDHLIEQKDLTIFIEVMAQSDFIGFKKMEDEILPVMGVRKNLMDQLDILQKPTKDSRFAFTPEVHLQVFEALNEGNKFVKFSTMLPYLMIFFLVELNSQVDKRLKNYSDLLDPHLKTSIFNCFRRAGLRKEDLRKKVITYRKIEEVIIDFRSCFPSSFHFEQMDPFLRQIRDRMQVDDFSHIEQIKESYFPIIDNGRANGPKQQLGQSHLNSQILPSHIDPEGYSIHNDNEGLSKWLAYNLGL